MFGGGPLGPSCAPLGLLLGPYRAPIGSLLGPYWIWVPWDVFWGPLLAPLEPILGPIGPLLDLDLDLDNNVILAP